MAPALSADAALRRARATPAEVAQRKEAAIEYIMTGFKQSLSVRHYSFQIVSGDRTRRDVTVNADLDMMRRHGLSIQEMPLLCRRLLETNEESRLAAAMLAKDSLANGSMASDEKAATSEAAEIIVFSETDMAGHAQVRATAKREQELRRRRPNVPVRTSTNPDAEAKGVARAV